MLTFRRTSLLFILVMVTLVLWNYFALIPVWVFVFISLVYVSLMAYGSAFIGSQFYLPVLCKAMVKNKSIAISFDDGPAEKYTPIILDILKRNQVPAAFFCIGKKVEANSDLVSRIDREGHLLGNHSYSHHFFFDFFSRTRISKELHQTNSLIKKITNKESRLFRPPYGVTTPNIAEAVRRGKFLAIGWSRRSMDTLVHDSGKLLQNSTKELKAGDVVLFHDTMELTAQVLQEFLDKVRQDGFRIVRLDQLLNIRPYV